MTNLLVDGTGSVPRVNNIGKSFESPMKIS